MTKNYNICGIRVECDFRFPTMTARAEKYLNEYALSPEMKVLCPEKYIGLLKQENPLLSDDDCEVIATAKSFYLQLLRHGGFMLHSSAVVMDGEAYLFSAPSGTGKSTHTALWLETFGGRARILNDDKPAIMVENGSVTACGTPWSGKSDLNLNLRVPLRGICMLERSKSNFIQPLPPEKSAFALLDQTLRPSDGERMGILLELLDEVTTRVPVWRMGCDISREAAEMAYRAMSGK